jgi:hypothetical protein
VLKTAPRGELTLKKFPGRRFGSEKVAGTPVPIDLAAESAEIAIGARDGPASDRGAEGIARWRDRGRVRTGCFEDSEAGIGGGERQREVRQWWRGGRRVS